jgi:tetratricopeptide (TPR) repeat protein
VKGRSNGSIEGDEAGRLMAEVEALRRSHPAEARATLARGFARALHGAAPSRRGDLWRLRGHVSRSLGELRPAVDAYRRAEGWYRRAGDTREMGRCAIGLTDALMYLGRYREAERVAARGRRQLIRAGDAQAVARLLNNEGNLYHRLDRPDLAVDRYRRAHRRLARAGDARAAGMIQGNIANCLSLLGRTGEARRLYQASRAASARAGQAVDALNADYNLAYLDFLEHRHEQALDGLSRARAEADRAGVSSIVALTRLDAAEILLRLGDHDAALEEATAAIALLGDLDMAYERAKAETFAALAEFRIGRPGAARARLERTLAMFLEEGNAVWAGEALVGLATLWWSQGSPAAAAPLLAAAARGFAWAADREREGCALALLARARLEAHGPGAARPLERARRLARARGSARLSHLTEVAAAQLALSRGDRALARRHLARAARESERLAARILDEQWRASFWGDWGWPHQELAALEMDAGRAEAALEALERGRGRVLASPWRRVRKRTARALRSWLAGRSARERERATRSAAPVAAARPLPPPQGLARTLAAPLGPEFRARDLEKSLGDGVALIDYALHRGQLSAFVVRSGSLEMVPGLASEREVARLAHDVLFDLRRAALEPPAERRADAGLARALAELASLILWPLLERCGGVPRALALVPSGPITRVPWAALPLPDGRPLCSAGVQVLVPGLRLGLARIPRARKGGRPLVIAANAEGLENVTAEAAAVAAALPGATVLTGEEATADRFLELAPQASWVHFAGHGVFQAGRSGLRLHDRWLLAEELDELQVSAAGVTLSACQTARALVRPGDEWFGLPRALLLAGAGAILASQWDVDDAATARFMADAYGDLARGGSLGEAVASAQSARAAEGAHPIDWAGFTVLGGPGAAAAKTNELSRARVVSSAPHATLRGSSK